MNRVTLILILSFAFTTSVHAEWTSLGVVTDEEAESEGGTQDGLPVNIYADWNTGLVKDGYRQVWMMSSNRKESDKSLLQVDCTEYKGRQLITMHYARPMGKGKEQSRDKRPGEWKYEPPDSFVYKRIFEPVCKKVR